MYDLPPRRRISLILVKLGPAHSFPQVLGGKSDPLHSLELPPDDSFRHPDWVPGLPLQGRRRLGHRILSSKVSYIYRDRYRYIDIDIDMYNTVYMIYIYICIYIEG